VSVHLDNVGAGVCQDWEKQIGRFNLNWDEQVEIKTKRRGNWHGAGNTKGAQHGHIERARN